MPRPVYSSKGSVVMEKDVCHIQSFAVIGLPVTRHGVSLIRHVVEAGLRPKFGLIIAQRDDQLERSSSLWSVPEWWEKAAEGWSETEPASESGAIGEDSVEALYRVHRVPYVFVPDLNGQVACEIISRGAVDAILLAEGPILREPILRASRCGVVNVHAAPLPEYRGNHATRWALYHDEPLCVSAHIVDKGIDTGPILARQHLPVMRTDTLVDVDERGSKVCGELAAEVFAHAIRTGVPIQPQRPWQGRTFKGQMPREFIEELERRLRDQEYSHYE